MQRAYSDISDNSENIIPNVHEDYSTTKKVGWRFTWFDYPPVGWFLKLKWYFEEIKDKEGKPLIKYICGENEICPTTGRKHIQGYVHFYEQQRGSKVFSVFETRPKKRKSIIILEAKNPGLHFKPADYSAEANRTYCRKDLEAGVPNVIFCEHGDLPISKGKAGAKATRDKWDIIRENAEKGDWIAIQKDAPYQYIQFYNQLQNIHNNMKKDPQRLKGVCGYWFYGLPNGGKSYLARQMIKHLGFKYYPKDETKWFQDYEDQEYIIFEEYEVHYTSHKDFMLGALMKKLGDREPFNAPIKGGGYKIRPKIVIVTSNHSIDECFPITSNRSLNIAIRRRYHEVRFLSDPDEEIPDSPMFDWRNPKRPAKQDVITKLPPKEGNWFSRFLEEIPESDSLNSEDSDGIEVVTNNNNNNNSKIMNELLNQYPNIDPALLEHVQEPDIYPVIELSSDQSDDSYVSELNRKLDEMLTRRTEEEVGDPLDQRTIASNDAWKNLISSEDRKKIYDEENFRIHTEALISPKDILDDDDSSFDQERYDKLIEDVEQAAIENEEQEDNLCFCHIWSFPHVVHDAQVINPRSPSYRTPQMLQAEFLTNMEAEAAIAYEGFNPDGLNSYSSEELICLDCDNEARDCKCKK